MKSIAVKTMIPTKIRTKNVVCKHTKIRTKNVVCKHTKIRTKIDNKMGGRK